MKKALFTFLLLITTLTSYSQLVILDFENNVADKSHPFENVYKNYQLIIATGGRRTEFSNSKTYYVYILQNNHWRKAIYTEPNADTPPGLQAKPIKEILTTDSACNALYQKLIAYKLFTVKDDTELPPCDERLQSSHPTSSNLWIITPSTIRHLYYINALFGDCLKNESRQNAHKILLTLGEGW